MQNASIAAPGHAGLGLGSLQKRRRGVRLTMGKNKTKTAKDEARILASKKTLKVEVQDATNDKS